MPNFTDQDIKFLKALKAKGVPANEALSRLDAVKKKKTGSTTSTPAPQQGGGNPLEGVGNALQGIANFGIHAGNEVVRGAGNLVNTAAQVADPITNINRLSHTVRGDFEGKQENDLIPRSAQFVEGLGGLAKKGTDYVADINQKSSQNITGKGESDPSTYGGRYTGGGAFGLASSALGGGITKRAFEGLAQKAPALLSLIPGGNNIIQGLSKISNPTLQKIGGAVQKIPGFVGQSIGETQGFLGAQGKLATGEDLKQGLTIDTALSALPVLGKIGKYVGKEALQKTTSVPFEAFETAFRHGDELSKVQKMGVKQYEEKLLNSLKSNLAKKQKALETTGLKYEELRNIPQRVVLGEKWLDNALALVGLNPKKVGGKTKIFYNADSSIRDPKDLTRLSEIYDTYSHLDKPTANQILNLRSDLSNLVENAKNRDDIYRFSSALRKEVDKNAKIDLPGLTKLDKKFGSQKKFLDLVEGEFENQKGNYRDTLDTLINRLGNQTNKSKLARMEKLNPGISKDVKLVKAANQIESASANQVGNYLRSIIGGGAIGTGNLPVALLSLATNPQIATGVAKNLGKISKSTSKTPLPKIVKSILPTIPKALRNLFVSS